MDIIKVPQNKPQPNRYDTEQELTDHSIAESSLKVLAKAPNTVLLHKFQVHQLELEMQNEELRSTQLALAESRDRYFDLFEFAPVGYLTLTEHGLIAEINISATLLLGIDRKKLLNTPFTRHLALEFSDCYHLLIQQSNPDERQSFEVQIQRVAGDLLYLQVDMVIVVLDSGTTIRRLTMTDISRIKRAENETLIIQQQLQATLNAIPDPIFELGLDGRYYECYSLHADLLAAPRESLLGNLVSDVLPAKVANVVMAALREANVTGASRDKQFELSLSQGNRWFELSITRKPSLINQEPRFIVISRDITQRKQAEQALQVSELQFRTLAEAMPQIVWMTRADGWNIYFNQQWVDYTGLTMEESSGHGWSIPFHPDDRQLAWDAWQLATKGDGVYSLESRIRRADGEYHWWLVRGVPLHDKRGKIINWYGTCTDISTQKNIQHQLRIAAITFEAQEAMLVTDEHGNMLTVNKAFTQLTGYSAAEAVGQPASMLKSGLHDATFFNVMYETVGRDGYWQGEIWNKRKNGEVFPGLMIVTAVISTDSQLTHYVGTLLDITVQKQAEKVLINASKRLEQQAGKIASELTNAKAESTDVNTALKIMMKMRQRENTDAKDLLILELEQEVMPFLQKLKAMSHDARHTSLVNMMYANLQRLISSYESESSITSAYKSLTKKEVVVASMVREGASTKDIASALSISPETIHIHRKNIRKKLGLESKANNLRSFLMTIDH